MQKAETLFGKFMILKDKHYPGSNIKQTWPKFRK